MPWDGIVFRDSDDGRSLTLSLTQDGFDRIAEMVRLSRNFINLNRTLLPTEPRHVVYEAIIAYKWYVGLLDENRDLCKYQDEKQTVVSLRFTLTPEEEATYGTSRPEYNHTITLYFADLAWGQLSYLQEQTASKTKSEMVKNALRYYEWGVLEAEKGIEIGSPNPNTGRIEIIFRKEMEANQGE